MSTRTEKDPLTQNEFEEVVETLAREQQDRVDEADARAALRELNIPDERLEHATEQVRARRQALALAHARKKKRILVFGASAALTLALASGVALYSHSVDTERAKISASAPALVLESGKLRFSARLANAPKGAVAEMSCQWRDASGTLLHENAWKTKPVEHDAWETHCVLPNAPEHVTVQMRAFGRVVAETAR